MKQADKRSSVPQRRTRKKAFKNFAEYWHFVKTLPEYQRKLLVNSMSSAEQKALKSSYDKGGWEDLFMRNACDTALDEIKKNTGIDVVHIRAKVVSGRPQLVHKTLWVYINSCFDKVPWDHISYIFDGMSIEDCESEPDYVKLVQSNEN